MQRVLILGCPGAGKSTAAKQLAAITGLPCIHLDQHYWLPGWQRPDKTAWRQTIDSLTSRPAWIMDGNYSGTIALRLAAADTLIHLDYPTALCVRRVLGRTLRGWGSDRGTELPTGCRERFDWPFLRFVIQYRTRQRDRDLGHMAGFSGKTFRFTAPAELSRFLAMLDRQSRSPD
jgi:adenylate kinase family enzyme